MPRRSAHALQWTTDEAGNPDRSSHALAVWARSELCPACTRRTPPVNVASEPYSKPMRAGRSLFATTFTRVCWIGPASAYVTDGAEYEPFSWDHATKSDTLRAAPRPSTACSAKRPNGPGAAS